VIVAGSPDEIAQMCGEAKVVVALAGEGPYLDCGEQVAKCCARAPNGRGFQPRGWRG
ncbi:unnamed protein product, partial [Effrenium voratum]